MSCFLLAAKKRLSGESGEPVAAAVIDDVPDPAAQVLATPAGADNDSDSDSTGEIRNQILPREDAAATTTVNDIGEQYDLKLKRWVSRPSSLSSVAKR